MNYLLIFLFSSSLYLWNKLYKYFNIDTLIGKSFIYNLSWEDPKTDIKLYNIKKGNRICMITTGGDNVIDYLIEDPESIYTYDLNKHQNFLLELKISCIKELTQNDCFLLFGKSNYKIFVDNYSLIKKNLSKDCKLWLDKNKFIMKNFLFSGSVKYAAKLFLFISWIYGCDKFF